MNMRNVILSGALTTLIPAPAIAQRPLVRPSASLLFRPTEATGAPADTLNVSRTYWKEGALIVGIPSAIFGGALGSGLCGMDESSSGKNCALSALAFGVVLGGVGAITGALIGGQFERH